ncbi:MAG: acyltransferase [Clostridiales bacterium]|jgi:hypothetical protein|nr:acyltransferase [Clostridiales bacterium]
MTAEARNNVTVFTVILCMLVILTHVTSEAVTGYDKSGFLYAAVFAVNKLGTFATPGFIFLSAFKYFTGFADGAAFKYRPVIVGRIKRVYLPYLLWVTLYYIYFVYIAKYFPFSIGDLLRYAALGDLSAQMYFVITIMQFYLLMPCWRVIFGIKRPAPLILSSAALALFITRYSGAVIGNFIGRTDFALPYADRWFLTYLPYWLVGMFAARHRGFLVKLKERGAPVSAVFLIIGAMHITLACLSSMGVFYYRFAEEGQMLFIAAAIPALLAAGGVIADKAPGLLTVFKRLETASYNIFLSHCLVLQWTNHVLSYLSVTEITPRLIVRMIATYSISIALYIGYRSIKSYYFSRKSMELRNE